MFLVAGKVHLFLALSTALVSDHIDETSRPVLSSGRRNVRICLSWAGYRRGGWDTEHQHPLKIRPGIISRGGNLGQHYCEGSMILIAGLGKDVRIAWNIHLLIERARPNVAGSVVASTPQAAIYYRENSSTVRARAQPVCAVFFSINSAAVYDSVDTSSEN